MGHVGLTPQAISSIGGFRPYGRSADEAVNVVKMALVRPGEGGRGGQGGTRACGACSAEERRR